MLLSLLANLDFAGGVATEPEPEPTQVGGGGWVREKDIESMRALMFRDGVLVAEQRAPVARLSGSVRNPSAPPTGPLLEFAAPTRYVPPAVVGILDASLMTDAALIGVVGLGPRDEAIAVVEALGSHPLDMLLRDIIGQ